MLQMEYPIVMWISEKKSTWEFNDNWTNCTVYLLFH